MKSFKVKVIRELQTQKSVKSREIFILMHKLLAVHQLMQIWALQCQSILR